MTKVFFDHQKFTTQRYGGISRYFATIIHAIRQEKDFEYTLGVLFSRNHYISDEKQALNIPLFRKLLEKDPRGAVYKLNQWYCRHLLDKNDFDVFHPTYYDPYFAGKLKKPLVTTIHDMTYERLPEYFWANDPLSYQKRISIERADQIIVISETTRKDLLELTSADPAKVKMIYHGIDLDNPLETETVGQLPEQYLLYVGDRSGYKNFYFFMQAFARLQQKYPGLNVILTGGGIMGTGDIEFIRRLKVQDKVKHIHVSDRQLNYLYSKALCFVYPSLYEGFGLPVLEAFKAKCPVLLSDTECFREIGAGAAAFFEVGQSDDLIDKIEQLIQSGNLRQELIAAGSRRLLNFPISKCIDSTLETYRSLV